LCKLNQHIKKKGEKHEYPYLHAASSFPCGWNLNFDNAQIFKFYRGNLSNNLWTYGTPGTINSILSGRKSHLRKQKAL
jgi:hypothetical protein